MRYLLILLLSLLLCSCRERVSHEREILSDLLGKEISIPDNLDYRILETQIEYDIDAAKYKIIVYIDSTGCTSCRMKLHKWDNVINELKTISDEDIAFLMIIKAAPDRRLELMLTQENFKHPVCFDPDGLYAAANSLPTDERYQTFLLDGDNRIAAVGNAAANPKIMELYRHIIAGDRLLDRPRLCTHPAAALGVISPGDTVTKLFVLKNHSEQPLTIQSIEPSCSCTEATISTDTIRPGEDAIVTLTLTADSIEGALTRYVEIFYNEKNNPERLTLHGFINNNINHKNIMP